MTASSSVGVSAFRMLEVATTTALFGPLPVANALGCGELTIPTLGIGIWASFATFLTTPKSVGLSLSWMSFALLILTTILSLQ